MDGRIFDDFTRTFAGRRTRRSMVKSLTAGLAGVLFGTARHEESSAAACRDTGHSCAANAQCCSGVCGPKDSRGRRTCACPPGASECGRDCVDLTTDPRHCGACGNRCPAGSACNGGTCGASNGSTCTSGNDCASGVCVDGICCDQACDGACQSCSTGTCTGTSGAPCGGDGACAGTCRSGTCVFPGGETVCGDATCSGSTQRTGYACNGAGVCVQSTADCGLYYCVDGACPNACDNDADCLGSAHCAGGICQGDLPDGQSCTGDDQCISGRCISNTCQTPLVNGEPCTEDVQCASRQCIGNVCTSELPNGEPCTAHNQCQSGHCIAGICDVGLGDGTICSDNVECQSGYCLESICRPATGGQCQFNTECPSGLCIGGTCCDRACTGGCETCESGVCRTIGAGDPPRDCAGIGLCQGYCDGVSPTCVYPGAETVCGADECPPNNTAVTYACNGDGTCLRTTVDCGLYRCAAGHCPATCADSGDCIDAAYCLEGVCVGDLGIGEPCTGDAECAASHCHDGFCNDICLARGAECTETSQCCQDGTALCEYDSAEFDLRCCSDVGGACPASTDLDNPLGCCQQPMAPPYNLGSYDQVFCAPIGTPGAGTCGGEGGLCKADPGCLSGSCCNTRCCPVGYRCNGAECLPIAGFCARPEDCAGGLCCNGQCTERTDDHCATCSDICGTNETCANAECRKDIGQTCVTGADCATGFCYDGVCCDECGGICGKPRPDTTDCRINEGGGAYMCCGGECIFPEGGVDPEHCGCGDQICPYGDICHDFLHRCSTCSTSATCNPDGFTVDVSLCNTRGVAAYCAMDVDNERFCVWGDFRAGFGPTINCGIVCESNDDCPQVERCDGGDCTSVWRCIRGDNTCCRDALDRPISTCVPVAPNGRGTTPAP
jgi:hypothetical protein